MAEPALLHHHGSGDNVYGDKFEEHLHITEDPGYWMFLKSLKDEMSKEAVQEFSKKLETFYSDECDNIRTLEEKLKSGGLSRKLRRAQKLEAKANKQIQKLGRYKAGEGLLLEIFNLIHSRFQDVVKEMINEDKAFSEIQAYIQRDIIDGIKAKMHHDELLSRDEISGMIYHLAQKCLIDWDKE